MDFSQVNDQISLNFQRHMKFWSFFPPLFSSLNKILFNLMQDKCHHKHATYQQLKRTFTSTFHGLVNESAYSHEFCRKVPLSSHPVSETPDCKATTSAVCPHLLSKGGDRAGNQPTDFSWLWINATSLLQIQEATMRSFKMCSWISHSHISKKDTYLVK